MNLAKCNVNGQSCACSKFTKYPFCSNISVKSHVACCRVILWGKVNGCSNVIAPTWNCVLLSHASLLLRLGRFCLEQSIPSGIRTLTAGRHGPCLLPLLSALLWGDVHLLMSINLKFKANCDSCNEDREAGVSSARRLDRYHLLLYFSVTFEWEDCPSISLCRIMWGVSYPEKGDLSNTKRMWLNNNLSEIEKKCRELYHTRKLLISVFDHCCCFVSDNF